jgi:hypothetical protein
MSAGTKSSVSKVALVIALIPVGIVVYWIAKMFLPVWLWTNVDFAKLATATGQTESRLRTEYMMTVRYSPRGKDDPIPWQIIEQTPRWADVDPQNPDEQNLLVRIHFLGDRHGQPPSDLILGSGGKAGFRDRYFTCTAYRLPPGVLGKGPGRPVVIYKAGTLEKLDTAKSMYWDTTVQDPKQFASDDDWDERQDGWVPTEP